jgi:hypothetical protein
MATGSSRPTYRVVDGVPRGHFDGIDDYMIAGAAIDWTFLNDGNDWTAFVVFRSEGAEPGGKYALLESGADFGNRGFAISYDDRRNTRRSDAVELSVADGTPGAYALTTGNRGFAPGKWGIISAVFKSTEGGSAGEAGLFVNGYKRVITSTSLRTYRSHPGSDLNIGRYGLSRELLTKGDIKEIVIYRRALSDAEQNQALQYLAGKLGSAVRIRRPFSRNWLNYNPEEYQAFGIAFRIPSTGKLVAIQRQGVAHVGGSLGEVRQWESADRGATWTNRLTYDSQYDDRGVGGGLASKSGTIAIFFSRYDGANWIDMRALRSVDDAQTFDDIGTPLPTNGCSLFLPYGPILELPSGRLLQTFYGQIGTTKKVWVSESIDDGLTWTYKADIYNGVLQVNETSLAWISGSDDETSNLVAVSRNDGGSGLLQFVSTDGGDTWTSQGLIPGGAGTDVSPWLYRLSDGTLVNAWHERSWFTFRIRMALASEVAESPSNWGPMQVTYQAATRVVGDSGYPALLSSTGWDEDLVEVLYDTRASGNANLLINPIFLP